MSLPCEICGIPLSDSDAMQYQRAHRCASVQLCIDYLRAALAHERDRARRVVRVFWRVRCGAGRMVWLDFTSRAKAWRAAKLATNRKVYRVTVRTRKRA